MVIKIKEPMPSAAVAQQVLELIHTAYADQNDELELEVPALNFTQDSLRQTIEDETLAVANLGRGLVGSVLYTVQGDDLFLHTLAVSPDHRRRGIAVALIEHVSACARLGGYRRVTLNAPANHKENHRLFERLGFREIPTNTWDAYKTPTFRRMAKNL